MLTLKEITQFTPCFPNHPRGVIRNLFLLTVCVLEGRSTNLSVLKDKVGGVLGCRTRQPGSYYTRLVRFFRYGCKSSLIRSILGLCFRLLSGRVSYLLLDGTKWKLGSRWIHLMVLSVVCGGVSIPIAWIDLKKKGHSNFSERKKLILAAKKYLCLKGLILIADREYEGENWFCFLAQQELDFIIRLKAKNYRKIVDQATGAAYSKLCKQARRRKQGASKVILINKYVFTYVVFRHPKPKTKEEELLFFLSTLTSRYKIIHTYPIRWKIECSFLHLKSNGFDLEAINFKDAKKIELMMAILVFAYVICIFFGQRNKDKIKLKRYKDQGPSQRPARSIFRHGLDLIPSIIFDIFSFCRFLTRVKSIPKIRIARIV